MEPLKQSLILLDAALIAYDTATREAQVALLPPLKAVRDVINIILEEPNS